VATPVLADKPADQPEPAKPHEQFSDLNKDKIFDNLAQRMASADVHEPFEVIVQFTKPLDQIDFAPLKKQIGSFSARYKYPSINAISTTCTKGQIIAASKHGLIKQIEFNGEVHACLDSAKEWTGVNKARVDFPGIDGNADGSPNYSAGDIVIAVVDTGIDANHVDLAGNKVIAWKDFVDTQSTMPYDDSGHGTHVASIAAGTGEASGGTYVGVAPGAALVGVKVLDWKGDGTFEDVLAGIEWVIANKDTYGIEIMNLSLGASGSSDGSSDIELALNQAVDAGIVVVVAAGNEGPDTYTIGIPGAAEDVITVGACADVGEGGGFQADFSNRGPTADGRIKPDISAPGWDIMAAEYDSTNGYWEMSGTSMATPFTTGVAALMLDANAGMSPEDVKTTIMDETVDWGPPGPDVDYGAGMLDAYQAVKTAGAFTTGAAPVMPSHDYQAGILPRKNSSDWWDIEVTDSTYPIAITMIMPEWTSHNRPDFDMWLYAPDGTLVGSSTGWYRQETISYQPPSIGGTSTYRLEVNSYSGSGPYFFDVSYGGAAATIADMFVELQGSSRPDPEGWAIPVTVIIDDTEYHCDTTKADDEDKAICQIDGLTPGTYTITIAGNTTLQNVRYNVEITSGENTIDMGTLLEGDANQDDIINISDFGILAVAFMSTPSDPNWDERADFDRNGIVNISDFGLLAVNFMKTSPVEVP